MQTALSSYSFQAIEFLLQAGADPRPQRSYLWLLVNASRLGLTRLNSISSTAIDQAWNIIFEALECQATIQVLRRLFPDNGHHLEERLFSRLHKIILGIHPDNLEQYLAIYSSDINAIDSGGQTALMWAARRGDRTAVELLLKANANVNIGDHRGNTALLYAALSTNVACVKMLLAAGTNQAQVNNYNENGLHMLARGASRGDSRTCVHVLVVAGVDVNGQNMWGSTPLGAAAATSNDVVRVALLDHGADIGIDDGSDNATGPFRIKKWPRLLVWILPCKQGILNDLQHLLNSPSWTSSIWTYWILGLFAAGIAYLLVKVDMSLVKSLFTFIWDMMDPSELE